MKTNNYLRDTLMFYEMMDKCNSVDELNAHLDHLTDCFRTAIFDLCIDRGWDIDDVVSDVL